MAGNAVLNNPMLSFMMMQNPASALQLQQQQALAQQLMEEGSAPSTTPQTAAGGVAIKQSPLEGLSKALEKGLGGYIQGQNNKKLVDLLSGGASPSQPALDASMSNGQGPTVANDQNLKIATAMQGNGASGMPSLTGDPHKDAMLYMMDSGSYTKGVIDQFGGTPEMKLAAALNPKGSAAYIKDLRDQQYKNTYVPDENVRAGSGLWNPKTQQFDVNNPVVPANSIPNFSGGRLTSVSPVAIANNPPITNNAATIPPIPSAPSGAGMTAAPAGATPPQLPSQIAPEATLPIGPGAIAADTETGKNNAAMVNNLRNAAADSPIRQDTYDKIINFSKGGVSTGGGAEMYNNIKNYAVNTPVLGPLAEKLTGSPSDYQELSKFLQRNAMQTWQAAGGTGTDAQLEASMGANANTKMAPQALQAVAQYGKAGEMALNAKNSFIQSAIGQNNENISKANQFENDWKQHFDPKVYQMALTGGDPKQMQQITAGMSPAQKTILMGKYQYAKQNGWLQ